MRITVLFLLFCGPLMAQTARPTVSMDPSVAQTDSLFKQWNHRQAGFPGFRVQLFNGSRQEAQKVKSGFSSQYPDHICYLTYQSPEYKVQVGDCRNEWEAEKLRKELHASYPAAIVVRAEIQIPKGS